jgi:predicted enzyme related to lactoylglutathione lyase
VSQCQPWPFLLQLSDHTGLPSPPLTLYVKHFPVCRVLSLNSLSEVSEPESYGFLDLITTDDGTGIRVASEGGPSYPSHAVFYVGVPNVEAALKRAKTSEAPGWGQATSPSGLVVGHFTDLEGTLIGIAGVT